MAEHLKVTRCGKLIVAYNILGSLIGLLVVARSLPRILKNPDPRILTLAFFLAVFTVLALRAATLILQRDRIGIRILSMLCLLQLPVLILNGSRYLFFWPLCLAAGVGPDQQIFMRWFAGAAFELQLGAGQVFEFAGLNLISLILLFLLPRSLKLDLKD